MSVVLSGQVILEQATPEYLARFDSYPGNPSNLDLGITGYLKRSSLKEGLFVGVEAKVDETFGGTVKSRYSSAMKTREAGKNTNGAGESERSCCPIISRSRTCHARPSSQASAINY